MQSCPIFSADFIHRVWEGGPDYEWGRYGNRDPCQAPNNNYGYLVNFTFTLSFFFLVGGEDGVLAFMKSAGLEVIGGMSTRRAVGDSIAASVELGLLATSHIWGGITVWALPTTLAPPVEQFTLGSGDWPMPFEWRESHGPMAARLAFSHGPSHLLLVCDDGKKCVHLVDVVAKKHMGYLEAPGARASPFRGVATCARDNSVALLLGHVINLYSAKGQGWTLNRVITSSGRDTLLHPQGLVWNGAMVFVADTQGVRIFLASGGSCQGTIKSLRPVRGLQEMDDGIVVADSCGQLMQLHGWVPITRTEGCSVALAKVPGLGLVSLTFWGANNMAFYATQDAVLKWTMPRLRLAWMCAVARGFSR